MSRRELRASDREDGTGRLPQHGFSHAAVSQTCQPAPSMRAHDDQVATLTLGADQNRLGRDPSEHHPLPRQTAVLHHLNEISQLGLPVRPLLGLLLNPSESQFEIEVDRLDTWSNVSLAPKRSTT